MSDGKTLHLLTGCTAVGKTALALDWAESVGAEIISCDSLLFYRGMDIGTAKPSAQERSRVPHHMLDVLEPDDGMNAVRYASLARTAAEDIRSRDHPILVTGGSGFYLKSFFSAVADECEPTPEIRARVSALAQEGGNQAVVAELVRLNPSGLGTLDTANPRRVARSLERCLVSGKPLSVLAEEFSRIPPAFKGWTLKLVRIDRPPQVLEGRIVARVKAMLSAGLVEEVRRLRSLGFEKNPSAARAIGYREVLACLDGKLPASQLEASIVQDTRALVKKQRTWFRTQLPAHPVFEAEAPGDLFGDAHAINL